MKLEHFYVENFRSIESAELDIHDINVLIGKNNAGKSNVANSLYRYRDILLEGNYDQVYHDTIMRGRESQSIKFQVDFSISKSGQKSIVDALAQDYGLPTEHYETFRDRSDFIKYHHEISIREDGISRNTVSANFKDKTIELGTMVEPGPNATVEQLVPSSIRDKERQNISVTQPGADVVFPDPFQSIITDELEGWKLIAPFRRPDAEGGFGAETELEPSGENLTTVLQALRGDGTERYERICNKYEEVMEGVKQVRIETVQNSMGEPVPRIRIDENNSSGIKLEEISSGSKEILLLITKIIRSESDSSVLFIEEPELHLHPAAEKEIYDLIHQTVAEDGPQVIITTHSDVFVDKIDIEKIISVKRDEHTVVDTVERGDLVDRLDDLGFDKSEFIQSDRVIFVEGRSDGTIFQNWARTLGMPFSEYGVEALVFDGDNIFEEGNPYADSIPEVLGQLGIPYLYIFDSDGESPSEKQEQIAGKLNESPAKIHVLSGYNIESYLAHSPRSIANVIDTDVTDIREEIPDSYEDTNMKGYLDDIFREHLDTGYHTEANGAPIAKNMTEDEIPDEIHELIEDITTMEGRR